MKCLYGDGMKEREVKMEEEEKKSKEALFIVTFFKGIYELETC